MDIDFDEEEEEEEEYDDDEGFDDEVPAVHDLFPDNSFMKAITIEQLNEEGYINLDSVETDEGFGYAKTRRLPAARWRQALNDTKAAASTLLGMTQPMSIPPREEIVEVNRIHPVFAREHWARIPDLYESKYGQWEDFLPVLKLATLLLEEESQIGFLVGLLDIERHKVINNAEAIMRAKRPLHSFEARKNPSRDQVIAVWRDLMNLKVIWRELDESDENHKGLHGLTMLREDNTITLDLNPTYFDILIRFIPVPEYTPVDWEPGTDEVSARLRTQWLCAVTIVHELMHALWFNKFELRAEPFYTDTRVAELGWQWEQEMFSGNPEPQTRELACPYVSKSCLLFLSPPSLPLRPR